MPSRLGGNCCSSMVDGKNIFFNAGFPQLKPAGTKGVCFYQLAPGSEILFMGFFLKLCIGVGCAASFYIIFSSVTKIAYLEFV